MSAYSLLWGKTFQVLRFENLKSLENIDYRIKVTSPRFWMGASHCGTSISMK